MTRTAEKTKTPFEAVRDAMAPTIESASTRNLCVMLATLDHDGLAKHERLVCDVLEEEVRGRHPEVEAAYEAWADDVECTDTRTLTRVIIDAALALS